VCRRCSLRALAKTATAHFRRSRCVGARSQTGSAGGRRAGGVVSPALLLCGWRLVREFFSDDGRRGSRAAQGWRVSFMTIRQVRMEVEDVILTGDLHVPDTPCGLVLFVHGSGSSRRSSRNRLVADRLNRNGLATL